MINTDSSTHHPPARGRWVVWTAGLVVAFGAAVATAHGLYEVAIAATVPPPIAWLYPLITDGLALVAYASTTRLASRGRGYAWLVVVLAAGLSGLAQASYLAIGMQTAPTELRFGVGAWPAIAAAITAHLLYLLAAVRQSPIRPEVVRPDGEPSYDAACTTRGCTTRGCTTPYDLYDRSRLRPPLYERASGVVRAGVVRANGAVRDETSGRPSYVEQLSGPEPSPGAGTADDDRPGDDDDLGRRDGPRSPHRPPHGQAGSDDPGAVRPVRAQPGDIGQPWAVRPDAKGPYGAEHPLVVRASESRPDAGASDVPAVQRVRPPVQAKQPAYDPASDSPGDRARAAAQAHLARHGGLPTVSALMELADVGRGTAGLALKQLREQPAAERLGLHIVQTDDQTGTSQ